LIFLVHTFSVFAASAAHDDSVRSEIREFYSGYLKAYTSKQTQELADNYLIAPFYFRNFEDSVFLETRQEVIDYFDVVFTEMSDQNYASSEITAKHICVLSDTSAIVSIAFRRFDNNGKVILDSGASYSLFKIDERWRFAMLSTHPPEYVVSCVD